MDEKNTNGKRHANFKLPRDVFATLTEIDRNAKASLEHFPVTSPGSGALRGFKSAIVAEALRIAGAQILERIKHEGVGFLLG